MTKASKARAARILRVVVVQLLELAGVVAVVAGVAHWSTAAAWIVAGLALAAKAFEVEQRPARRDRPGQQ